MGQPTQPGPNDYGTVGDPAVSGTGGGAVQVNPSNRGDKARVGTDAFLQANGLDPQQWHLSSNLPTQKLDSQGGKVKDNYIVTAVGPEGEVRTITLVAQPGQDLTKTPLDQVDWNATGVEQTVRPGTQGASAASQTSKAEADAQQARAAAAEAKARQDTLEAQEKERQKNLQASGYAITDNERATIEDRARSAGLTQQQIDNQLKIASDNNKNAQTTNDISLLRAKSEAQIAAKTAEIQEARLALDTNTNATDADIRRAAAEALGKQNEIVNLQNQQQIDEKRLTDQQTNQIQQGTLAQRTAEGAETGRHNLAQEAQTAAATKATAEANLAKTRTDAAQAVLTGTNQAATTGAGLLNQRVSSASSMMNQFISAIGSNKNLMSWPSGLGENMTAGLREWVTTLGGGQPVYDAAAAMVNQANPSISGNPTLAQQAYTALRGLMDLHQAETGQPALPQDGMPQSVAAPVSTPYGSGQDNSNFNPALAAANQPNQFGFNPQASTAAANAQAAQAPVQAPVTAGMYNPAYAQAAPSAVGMPSTGPVAGAIQPLPIPPYPWRAPVTA